MPNVPEPTSTTSSSSTISHTPVIYAITTQPAQRVTAKRKQVKVACTNCQQACKKCDECRPCQRCVKYELGYCCIDSVRKERQRGAKRGPYNTQNRRGKNRGPGNSGMPRTEQSHIPVSPVQLFPVSKVVYPQFYGQYPIMSGLHTKPGEPIYLTSVSPSFCFPPLHSGSNQAGGPSYTTPPFVPFTIPTYNHSSYTASPVLPHLEGHVPQSMPLFPQYVPSYALPHIKFPSANEAGPISNIPVPTGHRTASSDATGLNAV